MQAHPSFVRNIRRYNEVAVIEGEGLGTGYEYFAKNAIIRQAIRAKTINTVLIVGLPEKYGFSMDFLILADILGAQAIVYEDRTEKIERAQAIVSALQEMGALSRHFSVVFERVDSFETLASFPKADLALSCELLQRVTHKEAFLKAFFAAAPTAVLFCPNGDNEAHNTLSGLKSVPMRAFREMTSFLGERALRYGYIDFPPFPPGIKRSESQRQASKTSLFVRCVMVALTVWCKLEKFWPQAVKRRFAHIVYVVA